MPRWACRVIERLLQGATPAQLGGDRESRIGSMRRIELRAPNPIFPSPIFPLPISGPLRWTNSRNEEPDAFAASVVEFVDDTSR